LEWNPPAGANKKIEISIDPVVNGTISGLKPKFIDPDSDIRFDVTRTTKDQPVSVTVNGNLVGGGSYSDALYDPGVPPLLPTYHYVTSEWHDMKFPWSKALPDTTPDEVCKEVTSEGAWSCHAYTCPKSCDKDVGGRSVNHNVESSGPFDGPPDYGDNTGQCRYTFICTHN
jgi:hypothetical protein